MTQKKIAVIVGSLRKESLNRKMAKQLIKLAPKSLDLKIVEIGDLQMYNEDLDVNPPQEWVTFRKAIKESDGVLFVTPEYNRSMSGAVKNALDVASRPYGQNVWNNKAGAVMSVSMSGIGGFGANHHLRQSAVFLNIFMLQQPEAYIAHGHQLFDENDNIKNEDTQKFVQSFIDAYATWVERIG